MHLLLPSRCVGRAIKRAKVVERRYRRGAAKERRRENEGEVMEELTRCEQYLNLDWFSRR